MSPSRRRILRIYGGLFLAAVFFVPYRSTHVTLNRDTFSNIVWQRTSRGGGYMFLLRLLRRSEEGLTDPADHAVSYALQGSQTVTSVRYKLNTLRLVFELSAIGLSAAFSFLFLDRPRRSKQLEGDPGLEG